VTRSIEDVARSFLLRNFTHANYSFSDKRSGDKGFDFWLNDKEKKIQKKIELKAHSGVYQRPSNLVEWLAAKKDAGNEGLSGAMLRSEARYVIRGRINYENSFTPGEVPSPRNGSWLPTKLKSTRFSCGLDSFLDRDGTAVTLRSGQRRVTPAMTMVRCLHHAAQSGDYGLNT
jgi:hypothetical protein